ncbi:MAG: glycosyltransferase family 4 protein [Verrucomicrobiota bacterium]
MAEFSQLTNLAMKILQVFNRYLEPGGEENSVARIANHLELGRHDVERFWRSSEEWKGEGAPSRWRQVGLLGKNPEALQQLREVHESFQPQLWILHNVIPVVSLGVYELARELGVPIVQWLHNYRPVSVSGTQTRSTYFREIMSGSWRGSRVQTGILAYHFAQTRRRDHFDSVQAWIAVSDAVRGEFENADWYSNRLATLRHSWDLCQDPGSGNAAEDYDLFLGRLTEEKGLRFLVKLYAEPEMQSKQLKIAGQGGLESELRSISTPNVEWVGYVTGDEKRDLIHSCRAVLFPSLWAEPLSTIAYEAYEQRRPILTSDRGGMREIVENGVTGRVLGAGDLEAWKNAIIGDVDPSWGDAGRDWLETNVDPKIWNERFLEIIREKIPSALEDGD